MMFGKLPRRDGSARFCCGKGGLGEGRAGTLRAKLLPGADDGGVLLYPEDGVYVRRVGVSLCAQCSKPEGRPVVVGSW